MTRIQTPISRIMVIGSPGAGKSTLARLLHQRTQLPLIHLDRYYWRPAWREPETEAWRQQVFEFAQGPRWIIDGNYGGTMDLRLARANLVVFLDHPPALCLFRVVKRHLSWVMASDDRPLACAPRLPLGFLRYTLRFRIDRRPGILGRLHRPGLQEITHILRTRSDVQSFVTGVSEALRWVDSAEPAARPRESGADVSHASDPCRP